VTTKYKMDAFSVAILEIGPLNYLESHLIPHSFYDLRLSWLKIYNGHQQPSWKYDFLYFTLRISNSLVSIWPWKVKIPEGDHYQFALPICQKQEFQYKYTHNDYLTTMYNQAHTQMAWSKCIIMFKFTEWTTKRWLSIHMVTLGVSNTEILGSI